MSDYRPAPQGIKLLNQIMDDFARKIGAMDLEDPKRAKTISRLHRIRQLNVALRTETDQSIRQKVDQLAGEILPLKADDPHRTRVIGHILRLSQVISKN